MLLAGCSARFRGVPLPEVPSFGPKYLQLTQPGPWHLPSTCLGGTLGTAHFGCMRSTARLQIFSTHACQRLPTDQTHSPRGQSFSLHTPNLDDISRQPGPRPKSWTWTWTYSLHLDLHGKP